MCLSFRVPAEQCTENVLIHRKKYFGKCFFPVSVTSRNHGHIFSQMIFRKRLLFNGSVWLWSVTKNQVIPPNKILISASNCEVVTINAALLIMAVAMTKVIIATNRPFLLQERLRHGVISYETSQRSVIDYLCFIVRASASNIELKY